MHITSDVSIGTIITIAFTIAGFLVAIGRVSAMLTATHADFVAHVKEDAIRFSAIDSSLADAAIKTATISATVQAMSNTLTAVAAAQLTAASLRPQEA